MKYTRKISEKRIVEIVPFEREKHMTEKYRSWFNDPRVTKYNSHGLFPYTKEKMEKFIQNIEDGGPDIIFAIMYKGIETESVPTHIGNCSIQSIDWINRSCELAFVIGETNFYGLGIGKAAGEMMLEHAFKKLGMNRVWMGTAETNVGMVGVAGKLGMYFEGNFRKGKFLNGEFVSILNFSILAEEYFDTDRQDSGNKNKEQQALDGLDEAGI